MNVKQADSAAKEANADNPEACAENFLRNFQAVMQGVN
jgi:hypothetical protein